MKEGLFFCFLYFLNVFFLDRDPKKCASYHGDEHIHKMPTEQAQICSTVYHLLVKDQPNRIDSHSIVLKELCAPSHVEHPVVEWAGLSLSHYMYVVDLGLALLDERIIRIERMKDLPKEQRRKWDPEHESRKYLIVLKNQHPPKEWFPNGDVWSDPPKCVPSCYHFDQTGTSLDVVKSYQQCYSGHKIYVTGLTWGPYTSTPPFIEECQREFLNRPDILKSIKRDKQLHKKTHVTEKGRKRRRPDSSLVERKDELVRLVEHHFPDSVLSTRLTKKFKKDCDEDGLGVFIVRDFNEVIDEIRTYYEIENISTSNLMICLSSKQGVMRLETYPRKM